MILTLFLQLLVNVISGIFLLLPSATTFPWGIDAMLVSGIGYLRFFIGVFPPFGTLLTAFLIYITFILGIKVVRLIPIIRHILD